MRVTEEGIWQTVIQPGPLMSDQARLMEKETQIIVLLRALRYAAFSDEELRSLLALLRSSADDAEKIVCLRQVRCQLLNRLHAQQQVLDDLDNYVDAMRRANG